MGHKATLTGLAKVAEVITALVCITGIIFSNALVSVSSTALVSIPSIFSNALVGISLVGVTGIFSNALVSITIFSVSSTALATRWLALLRSLVAL